LFVLNVTGVTRRAPYILVGAFIWVCVLKSGVHATLAGVALGLAIPLRTREGDAEASPLRQLEHTLHPWVAFAIVPIFGFANAGVAFTGIGLSDVVAPIPLGIVVGLFLGKPLGVLAGSWLVIRGGVARRPDDVSWSMLIGAAVLCGIGFTMSLFIGTLAYEHAVAPPGALDFSAATRLGVLLGSLLSALVGLTLLARACRHVGHAKEASS
jgi:NhaA family Na+:H+ antiporter